MFDHVKFGVSHFAASKAFYLATLAAGAQANGPPGLRPHYNAHCYAVFVIGPDGRDLEAVCQLPAS